MRKYRSILLIFICIICSCSLNHDYRSRQAINKIIRPYAEKAFIGLQIYKLNDNKEILSLNSEHIFTPASCLKLFTTYSALKHFGTDYRFQSSLYYSGSVKDSILYGDLYFKSSGDPELGNENSSLADWNRLKNDLRISGIKSVRGELYIIGKNPESFYRKGWMLDDLNSSYQSEISSLSYKNNLLEIEICSDSTGLTVNSNNKSEQIKLINKLIKGIDTNVKISEIKPLVFEISGTIKDNSKKTLRIGFSNSQRNNYLLLRSVLMDEENSGMDSVLFIGYEKINPDTLKLIKVYNSSPLSVICSEINKKSNNHYAEQIREFLLEDDVFKEDLQRMGVDSRISVFDDGSGLSVYNKCKVSDFTKLLFKLYAEPMYDEYLKTLSVGGIDGTLKARIKNPEYIGRVFGKSGSMRNVSNVICIYNSKKGNCYGIVFLANNIPADLSVYSVIEEIISKLE